MLHGVSRLPLESMPSRILSTPRALQSLRDDPYGSELPHLVSSPPPSGIQNITVNLSVTSYFYLVSNYFDPEKLKYPTQ